MTILAANVLAKIMLSETNVLNALLNIMDSPTVKPVNAAQKDLKITFAILTLDTVSATKKLLEETIVKSVLLDTLDSLNVMVSVFNQT